MEDLQEAIVGLIAIGVAIAIGLGSIFGFIQGFELAGAGNPWGYVLIIVCGILILIEIIIVGS